MSVDNRFRNAEAETGSTGLSIVGDILLRELFENLLVELAEIPGPLSVTETRQVSVSAVVKLLSWIALVQTSRHPIIGSKNLRQSPQITSVQSVVLRSVLDKCRMVFVGITLICIVRLRYELFSASKCRGKTI